MQQVKRPSCHILCQHIFEVFGPTQYVSIVTELNVGKNGHFLNLSTQYPCSYAVMIYIRMVPNIWNEVLIPLFSNSLRERTSYNFKGRIFCFLITTNIKMTQLSSDRIKISDNIYFVLSKLSRMENANKSCHSQKPK